MKTLFSLCSIFVLEKQTHQSAFIKSTCGSVSLMCFRVFSPQSLDRRGKSKQTYCNLVLNGPAGAQN